MSDWRTHVGIDPQLIDTVPSVLWMSDLAKEQLSGNGQRSPEDLKPHLMSIASHHIELVTQYARVTGEVPTIVIAIHQEPRLFMLHCLISIHGCAYTGDRVVIARDDEIFDDITTGRISASIIPPEALSYLHYRQVHRDLLVN